MTISVLRKACRNGVLLTHDHLGSVSPSTPGGAVSTQTFLYREGFFFFSASLRRKPVRSSAQGDLFPEDDR
jgi:hypothetical protein